MTREEALTEMKERVHVAEYVNSSYVDCVDIEALRMAIKALEQPEPCEDTVSRQAAIDAVSRGCQEFRGIFAECEKNLNELPPAQQVHNTGKWVRGTCYGLGIYNWTCKCGHVIAAKVPDRFCGACGCDNAERRTDE